MGERTNEEERSGIRSLTAEELEQVSGGIMQRGGNPSNPYNYNIADHLHSPPPQKQQQF